MRLDRGDDLVAPLQLATRLVIGAGDDTVGVGGIGAAAGLLACTAISTIADDSTDGGVSFCPLASYLLIGGASFLVGAAIGWLS